MSEDTKTMSNEQPKNPLHGITLKVIVTKLVDHYDWQGLAEKIDINCFKSNPSIKSTLKFLRKTPWARDSVEKLYVATFSKHDDELSNYGVDEIHLC